MTENTLVKKTTSKNLFTQKDKEVYQKLANALDETLEGYYDDIIMHNSSDVEIKLSNLLTNSELEDIIQSNNKLLGCFLKNEFICKKSLIEVSIVKDFYDLFTKLSIEQKDIVLHHLLVIFEENDAILQKEYPF